MRIIVLQGMPNTGKTSTLNLAYHMLVSLNGNSTNKRPYGGDPNDFKDIILWNNQKIGILSMGDQSTFIANEIRDFNQQNCDVVVCALSTNDSKVRANNALNQYNTTRINKTIAIHTNEELLTNASDAQTIFNLI
jgi:hypothetical protein